MALNIKNDEVERLVAEIAALTGESKTEAVRRALLERRERLAFRAGDAQPGDRLRRVLEQEIWPVVPRRERGRRLTRRQEDAILGDGPEGA